MSKHDRESAPVELMIEFLKLLEDSNFMKAQEICQRILILEPENPTIQMYSKTLTELIQQNEENPEEDNTESDEGSSDDDQSGSEVQDDDEVDSEGDDDDDDSNEHKHGDHEYNSNESKRELNN